MAKSKATPLTLDALEKSLLPRMEEVIDERMAVYSTRLEERIEEKIGQMEDKLKIYRNEVLEFKDEVIGEVKGLREEVAVALHQYERTTKRVEDIEKHLNIDPID
ncbi:MAG: hypothetical protein HYW33_01275 [Candidatus Blackburnbacteria bacterium]|nr:hypothetical protein [Candidatus Blackburnbacteria bacterium]